MLERQLFGVLISIEIFNADDCAKLVGYHSGYSVMVMTTLS